MLFALTNLHHLIGDSVQMTQRLFLDNQTFCLSFYYQARTDMTFKVKNISLQMTKLFLFRFIILDLLPVQFASLVMNFLRDLSFF